MPEIGSELCPAGKALTPGPWFPHFGDREFVEWNLRIHACAGIAIPVPDAARIARRIDQQHVDPVFTPLVQQVDAAAPRPAPPRPLIRPHQLGRASCRERMLPSLRLL